MQKVESWPQLQDAIKTTAHSTNIVTIQTLSAALQSVNPLLHTLFLWLTGLFDTSHFATSSFDTS